MSEMLEAFAMSGMIDRVSRAICEAEYGVGATVDNVHKLQAIAAVRALREPTDEMMAEAYCKITVHIEVDNRDLYNAWRAAIDSILSTRGARE